MQTPGQWASLQRTPGLGKGRPAERNERAMRRIDQRLGGSPCPERGCHVEMRRAPPDDPHRSALRPTAGASLRVLDRRVADGSSHRAWRLATQPNLEGSALLDVSHVGSSTPLLPEVHHDLMHGEGRKVQAAQHEVRNRDRGEPAGVGDGLDEVAGDGHRKEH